MLGVLALGDAAGEGLAAGLEMVAGVFSIAAAGEADGEGLAAAGEFELLAGSVAQPAANTIENIVRSRSAVQLMMLSFAVPISFCLVSARLKSETMIAREHISSNGRSHRSSGGISAQSAPKPSFSKKGLHD